MDETNCETTQRIVRICVLTYLARVLMSLLKSIAG